MVSGIDLQKTHPPTSGDISGLWACLQSVLGQPFLFFRQSYAEELTIHLGAPRVSESARIRRRDRGSYVLTLRGSIWTLVSGPRRTLLFSDPAIQPLPGDARPLDLGDLEKEPPVEPGATVIVATPFEAREFGGYGLVLGFSDQSRFMIRPSATTREGDRADDLPDIADWELFTPFGRYLRVGPGLCWTYLPSGSAETAGGTETTAPAG